MKPRATRARLLVGGLVLGGLIAGAQPQAQAGDCVSLQLYLRRSNMDPVWVYGEHNSCVVPTEWNDTVTLTHGDINHLNGQPDGTPNGYHMDLHVPLP